MNNGGDNINVLETVEVEEEVEKEVEEEAEEVAEEVEEGLIDFWEREENEELEEHSLVTIRPTGTPDKTAPLNDFKADVTVDWKCSWIEKKERKEMKWRIEEIWMTWKFRKKL